MNAPEAVRRLADGADRTWLDTGRRTIRFKELDERIRSVAALLAVRGIAIGDRIVIASRDDAETALNFVALVANGVTAINLDPETAAPRAQALIARSTPRLMIIDAALADGWALAGDDRLIRIEPASASGKLLGGLVRQAPASGFHAELAAAGTAAPPAAIPPETLAYILFTSGTTQQPKGVCISHRALFAHLATLNRIYGCDEDSVILNTLMLSHADGITQGPLLAWFALATLHRPFPFEIGKIDQLLDAVHRLRISHMIVVPTMLALIVRLGGERRDAFEGEHFRLLSSSGAALEAELWTEVEQRFGVSVINLYGLTETVAGGVFAGGPVGVPHPGSIGRPIDCELRIVDTDGRDVGVDEPGELLMRGELLMSGYFDDPALTAETMVDGWFYTGDLASRNADGIYFIRGRIKNIVIRGGVNISPEEIVEALNLHPAVREATAFGIADPIWGEQLVALAATDGADEAELRRHAQSQLEPRKLPDRIVIVDALPRGRSGKVVIDEARALYERSILQPEPALPHKQESSDDVRRLLAIAAGAFRTSPDQLTLDASPDDVFGWDSMAHMEFVVALEQEFGVFLSPSVVIGIDRLSKALDAVRTG